MPRFLLPKRSTQHRVAAIALYKALLSRCASAPLPDEHRSPLQNVIRQKFRRNKRLQGPHQLGLAFRAGYETLDHLDAASSGDRSSTQFLTSFISSLPAGLKRPPPTSPRLPPPHPSKTQLACLPPKKTTLNIRPHRKVFGPRHVPILCSANGVPFLRIKKPQPLSLSRVLRQKLARRQERFGRRTLFMNYWLPIANQEDEWDEILLRYAGIREDGGEPNEVKWKQALEEALSENTKQYEQELFTDKMLARKMQGIVDQETALALKEGRKVVRGRKRKPIPQPK